MLNWKHHALIQALLSRGPLKEDDLRSLFSVLISKASGNHQKLFDEYLLKINKELNYVQFELRACRNQYDGTVYYGVVNNVADEQSKFGTKYSVPQIAFYKAIIEAIIQDGAVQGSISNIDALNLRLENQIPAGTEGGPNHLPHAFRTFSMSQKEKALEEFVRDQWLCLTQDNQIGFGVRSFLDLRSWFRSNEVPTCEICNEAALKALLCQNGSCNVRIHEYCLKKKFSQKRAKRVCPSCGSQWDQLSYSTAKVEVVEEEDNQNGPSRNSQVHEASARKRSRNFRDIDGDGIGSGSSQSPTHVRATRCSARLRISG